MGITYRQKRSDPDDDSYSYLLDGDSSPKLTQFVNDVGEFYAKCIDWPLNPARQSQSFKERIFKGIEKYLNEQFIRELRKELKLD